jgi:hypothetical protein
MGSGAYSDLCPPSHMRNSTRERHLSLTKSLCRCWWAIIGELPMAESIEWHQALQAMKVPSRTAACSNEGRIFYRNADARDCTHRTLRWFEQWFAKEN